MGGECRVEREQGDGGVSRKHSQQKTQQSIFGLFFLLLNIKLAKNAFLGQGFLQIWNKKIACLWEESKLPKEFVLSKARSFGNPNLSV